jgi:hypothetical protein
MALFYAFLFLLFCYLNSERYKYKKFLKNDIRYLSNARCKNNFSDMFLRYKFNKFVGRVRKKVK